MTPYTERRAKGYYNTKGEKPASTTTNNLAGLGTPQPTGQKTQRKKKS